MLRYLILLLIAGVAVAFWIMAGRKLTTREFVILMAAMLLLIAVIGYAAFDFSGSSFI